MNKEKILFITNLCSPYRVGLFELLHKKFDTKFIFFSSGEEKYYDGQLKLGVFNGEYVKGFYLLPKIKINPKLILNLLFYNYNCVIKCINGPFPVLISFIIAKIRMKKFILWTGIWAHPQTVFHRNFYPVVKYIYAHSDAIIAYGLHVKKYLISLGVPEKNITIGWQAQDNEKFLKKASISEKETLRNKIGIKTSKVILFVGRMVEEKGIRILIQSFVNLDKQDVSLLFVGNGPMVNYIKDYIDNDRIFYHQKIPAEQLYVYYSIADIFVLPSITSHIHKETWGFVINEAMCQGCAIIASDAVGAGVGGLVEENRNGIIVPENNPIALQKAFEIILGNDDILNSMKERSLEIIKSWTYDKMAEGFSEAIRL